MRQLYCGVCEKHRYTVTTRETGLDTLLRHEDGGWGGVRRRGYLPVSACFYILNYAYKLCIEQSTSNGQRSIRPSSRQAVAELLPLGEMVARRDAATGYRHASVTPRSDASADRGHTETLDRQAAYNLSEIPSGKISVKMEDRIVTCSLPRFKP